MLKLVNKERCEKRITPASTFKVPLSLIGYDSGILIDENNPKWKYKPEYPVVIGIHTQDHTPKSWMAYSVVWYSQILTQKLGMDKFKEYIAKLSYGNQDLSGDIGKNNGLTESWLNTSLKISAYEQIDFLKEMITYNLPISKEAIDKTKNTMFVEELKDGWKLYGKSGSGYQKDANGTKKENVWLGWYVGFIEKSGQTYIFALNIFDKVKTTEFAGLRAKEMTKEIISQLDYIK